MRIFRMSAHVGLQQFKQIVLDIFTMPKVYLIEKIAKKMTLTWAYSHLKKILWAGSV